MNNNVKDLGHNLTATLARRLEELDGTLACIRAAQTNADVSDSEKQLAISACRRKLVDLICDIEQLSS